jgi:N-acylneuraminate cytidylyltransferase
MDALVLIPARSGSTRVKHKNIRPLGGIPLLGHIVSTAVSSGVGRVIVSTNSDEHAAVARSFGAETPFRRPAELAQASSSALSTILHALQWLKLTETRVPELVAICPPTNPFTAAATISGAAKTLSASPEFNSIVTITVPHTHPFRIVGREPDGRLRVGLIEINGKTIHDVERTQDWPTLWEGSPACRMTRSSYFMAKLDEPGELGRIPGKTYDPDSCLGFEIDRRQAFDIDDEEDWAIAEALSKKS